MNSVALNGNPEGAQQYLGCDLATGQQAAMPRSFLEGQRRSTSVHVLRGAAWGLGLVPQSVTARANIYYHMSSGRGRVGTDTRLTATRKTHSVSSIYRHPPLVRGAADTVGVRVLKRKSLEVCGKRPAILHR